MVCNHGQSELLMNFVCSAKSRNLDLGSVLVFATDEETKELAEGLGLAAFFDKTVSFVGVITLACSDSVLLLTLIIMFMRRTMVAPPKRQLARMETRHFQP